MAVQVYTFKITYADCDEKIWRIAAVSSNYTLAELGYMVLATFDTMAYHLFEMRYKDNIFFLSAESFENLQYNDNINYHMLSSNKINSINMNIGDKIEMVYDLGCEQVFDIELIEISDMPRGHGRAYPKILNGAGRGIVDDMPAVELLEAIRKTDENGHSEIYYSSDGFNDVPEWDYRDYRIDCDNGLLKSEIDIIRDGYEGYEY